MTTWTGNRYWFTADGARVVAYRVIGGVALTTGDPVGRAGRPGRRRPRASPPGATSTAGRRAGTA